MAIFGFSTYKTPGWLIQPTPFSGENVPKLTNVNGVWKNIERSQEWVNVNGGFRAVAQEFVNDNDVWRPVFAEERVQVIQQHLGTAHPFNSVIDGMGKP